jgi:hypothetical protein
VPPELVKNITAAPRVSPVNCRATARAHHSFGAEYDAQRPVTVTGVVTKIEWTNPHCHFHVDAGTASSNACSGLHSAFRKCSSAVLEEQLC